MSKQTEQIQVLLEKSKASAPDITNPLKVIGDGNMLDGVKKFYEHALHEGEKSGMIKGCVATTIIFGVCTLGFKSAKYIKRKYQYNKHQKQVGEEIIRVFSEQSSVDNEVIENAEEGKEEL